MVWLGKPQMEPVCKLLLPVEWAFGVALVPVGLMLLMLQMKRAFQMSEEAGEMPQVKWALRWCS